MPLLDRLRLLGMLDDSDAEQPTGNAVHDQKASTADVATGKAGRAAIGKTRFGKSKNKKSRLTCNTDSGLGDSASSSSSSSSDNDADTATDLDLDDDDDDDDDPSSHDASYSIDSDTGYEGDDCASSESDLGGGGGGGDDDGDGSGNMAAEEMRAEETSAEKMAHRDSQRRNGVLAYLGTAEEQRQRTKRAFILQQQQQEQQQNKKMPLTAATGQPAAPLYRFMPVTRPTGDLDAGEGFHVCGFKDGKRVYRLETLQSARLRSLVAKTAVGFCYLDIAAMLPPKVVTVSTTTAVDGNAAAATTTTTTTTTTTITIVNGCFEIRPSALGGLGAFAQRGLLRGEHILVEAPLLRSTLFHMPAAVDQLPPEKRAQFDALAGHHPDPNASTIERIWTANTFMTGPMDAVFALASRFNHACPPRNNIGYCYDTRRGVLILTAIKKIAAGTELTITYGKSPSMLFQRYGFRCTCGACSGYDEDTARQMQVKNW